MSFAANSPMTIAVAMTAPRYLCTPQLSLGRPESAGYFSRMPSRPRRPRRPRRPVVLVVLDGWGYREEREGNAIALANTPTWDRLWGRTPRTLLEASGLAVGLPEGQMGNSEVGHLNLGAGRVVMQDLVRINRAIE